VDGNAIHSITTLLEGRSYDVKGVMRTAANTLCTLAKHGDFHSCLLMSLFDNLIICAEKLRLVIREANPIFPIAISLGRAQALKDILGRFLARHGEQALLVLIQDS